MVLADIFSASRSFRTYQTTKPEFFFNLNIILNFTQFCSGVRQVDNRCFIDLNADGQESTTRPEHGEDLRTLVMYHTPLFWFSVYLCLSEQVFLLYSHVEFKASFLYSSEESQYCPMIRTSPELRRNLLKRSEVIFYKLQPAKFDRDADSGKNVF